MRGTQVKSGTSLRRVQLIADLNEFLLRMRLPSVEHMLYDAVTVDETLEVVGRIMFTANRSLHDYTETINAVVSMNRRLRKQLTLSWDVADSWAWAEPSTPRLAMPEDVLHCIVGVALLNGMPFAGFFFWLCFECMLRPSEALSLRRRHIKLPTDLGGRRGALFLMLLDTKTSRRGVARIQYAKASASLLIKLATLLLSAVDADALVFGVCMGTMRKRLEWCLEKVLLHTVGLGLGAFRGGGAIAHFEKYEDLPLTQWRGRWDTLQNMQRYIQEASVEDTFVEAPAEAASRVRAVLSRRSWILNRSFLLLSSGVLPKIWPRMFSSFCRFDAFQE